MLRVCHLLLLFPGMCAMRAGSCWANQAPKELSVNSCPTACGEKWSQNNFGLLLTKSNCLNPKWLHLCRALLASEKQLMVLSVGLQHSLFTWWELPDSPSPTTTAPSDGPWPIHHWLPLTAWHIKWGKEGVCRGRQLPLLPVASVCT